MSFTIIPRMSEKAYGASQLNNVFTFVVPTTVNKDEIKKAVEAQFSVTVTDVNISVLKGKVKKTNKKRGRQLKGTQQDIKKAYVTLKEGDNIPVFVAEAETENVPTATQKGRK